jgi:hypothetical protein
MPLDEATLKRQLDLAKTELAVWVKKLDSKEVAATARRKDATWRRLNAACNTIKTRLKAVAAVKARDEAVAQHKAEKLSAAAVVEKEPKKAAKEPKAKEKAPKKEKGEGKKPEKGGDGKEKKKKE